VGFGTLAYHPDAAAAATREVDQFLKPSR